WDLRDFPAALASSAGGLPLRWDAPTGSPAFQKFISIAVLLPESFRGGCSFGLRLTLRPTGRLVMKVERLPRGIMCWPRPCASRRKSALRRIISGELGESMNGPRPNSVECRVPRDSEDCLGFPG